MAYAGDVSEPAGGTDRVTALAGGLADRGHDITLVVPTPNGTVPDRLADVAVKSVTPLAGNQVGRAVSVARTALKRCNSDTHLQFEHSLLCGVGELLGGQDLILDMHDLAYARFDHVDALYAPLARRTVSALERYATNRASHIIAVSEYMREFLIDQWGVPDDRISVVPNGYFPSVLDGISNSPEVQGRVCFLGTLHPKVDTKALCEIAALPAVSEMIVIGDGAQREELEQAANKHSNLKITGRLPDDEAFKLLATAQLLVNPQQPSELQRSSSPVKLYYYAALGKPFVTTRGPSVVEDLVAENACRSADSREEFINIVGELLRDQELSRGLGVQAQHMAENFQWEQRVKEIEHAYTDIGT